MNNNPSPEPEQPSYSPALTLVAARQNILDWSRPYLLAGAEPNMKQPDVAVVSHMAALARYYVRPLPSLVIRLDPIAYSTAQPLWYVTFREHEGGHVFHEASGGGYVCHELAGFLEVLDRCRPKMPVRFGAEAA